MPARATPWLLILAVLLGLAAHAPARHAAFQFDDFPAVVENPALQTPFRFGDLRRPSAAGADYVRPVLFLTYRVCDAFAGVSDSAADLARRARAQHTGNLVLHLVNVLLVYAWGRGLGRRAGEERSAAPAIAKEPPWPANSDTAPEASPTRTVRSRCQRGITTCATASS